jgi:hypothetical protein
MGPPPVEDGPEGTREYRVMERGIGVGLGGELPPGGLIADEVGTQDLGDDQAEEPVIPGQVRLVTSPSAQKAHREATRGDLLALVESPHPPGLSHHSGLHDGPPFASLKKKVRDAREPVIRAG